MHEPQAPGTDHPIIPSSPHPVIPSLRHLVYLAMLLAAVGLYGVMSYLVTQSTHDIGILVALGARRENVLALVVRQGMQLTLIGILAGLIGAAALTRVIASLLFGVSATAHLRRPAQQRMTRSREVCQDAIPIYIK